MGLFARNAAWLKNYFTPSVSPGFVQPVAVSEDVQLTHPYTSGWEQSPLSYFFTDSLLNPGQNANLFLIIPPVLEDPTQNDVIWRVIAATIEIPAGPTGAFNFKTFIGDNATAGLRIMVLDEANVIGAGITTEFILVPNNNYDAGWPMVITREGLRTTGIGLRQTSAQAALSEGITVNAWILRAPRGGSLGAV